MPSALAWLLNVLAIVVGTLLARAVRSRASDSGEKATDWVPGGLPDRMQFLVVGAVIGATLASLRTVLGWVLSRLRWLDSALHGVVSTGTAFVLALVAVGFMTAYVTLLVRSSFRNIDTKLDSIHRNVAMTRSGSEHGQEDANAVESDGGRVDADAGVGYRPDTSGVGMVAGAVVGGIVGLPIGPGGAIGGATAGAAFGDTLEQASIKRRDRRQLERRVVRALLQHRSGRAESVPESAVLAWFPTYPATLVREVLARLAADPDSPVGYDERGEAVRVVDAEAAKRWLLERGGAVPWTVRA